MRLWTSLVALILVLIGASSAALAGAEPIVSGTVVNSHGAAVAGARASLVALLPADDTGRMILAGGLELEPAAATTSDAAGRFRLAPRETGVWRLVVEARGFVPMHFFPLVLVAPAELRPVALPADQGGELRLLDSKGLPVTDVWVWASTTPGSDADGSATGATGWWADLRAGRTDADGRVFLPRAVGEQLDLSVVAEGRMVASHRRTEGGTLRLKAAPLVNWLAVSDREGRGLAGVLAQNESLVAPWGVTGPDGRLKMPARPGDLRLTVANGRRHSFPIPVPNGELQTWKIELADPVELAGRLIDQETRKPIAGAVVWSLPDPGIFTHTDSQGRYRLPATADPGFRIQAEAAGHLPRSISIEAQHLAALRAPTVALVPAATLSGEVVDPGGRGLSGVRVEAVGLRGRRPRGFFHPDPVDGRALSDREGRFRVGGLEAGLSYALRLSRSGFTTASATVDGSWAHPDADILRLTLAPARGAFGRVVDEHEQPIADAEVILTAAGGRRPSPLPRHGPEAPQPFRGRTAASGRFAITELPADEIQLTVYSDGYRPTTVQGIEIPTSVTAEAADLGTVILTPGMDLTGRIMDRSGEAIAGAALHVLRQTDSPGQFWGLVLQRLAEQPPDAMSDSGGHFRVRDLGAGEPIHLVVRRSGYVATWVERLTVPPDQPLTVVLDPGLRIAGRVVDEAGEGVAGAELLIEQEAVPRGGKRGIAGEGLAAGQQRSLRSEPGGRFAIEDLRAAPTTLNVFHPGYMAPEAIAMTAGEANEDLVIVLESGASLEGEVTTAAGEPIAEVRVLAGAAAAASDADGMYRLEGVAPGPAVVVAEHPHYGQREQEIEIEIGGNVLDLTFPDGHGVGGRVVDEEGSALDGATIALYSEHGAPIHRGRTTPDGDFHFQPVADGTYRLAARRSGFAVADPALTVRVAGTAVEDLEIVLFRGTTISGQILGLEFDEIARLRVIAEQPNGPQLSGHVDYQGGYEIRDLPPGAWRLEANLDGGRRQVQVRVHLVPGTREVSRDLRFEPRYALSGQVLLDGESLPGTAVSLAGHQIAVNRSVTTDYLGAFKIEDLAAGSYRLGLANGAHRLVHNQEIELTGDRDMVLDLRPARLSGVVVEALSGRSVEQALVVLRRLAEDGAMVNVLTRSSDPEGRFDFRRVPEGRYQLLVRKDGYAADPRHIDIPEGVEMRDVELAVRATRGIDLDVRLASGGLPAFVTVVVLDPQGGLLLRETRSVDAHGRLRLPTVPAGSWQLVVSAPGAAASTLRVAVPGEPVVVPLDPAGTLEVRVAALQTVDQVARLRLLGADNRPFRGLDPASGLIDSWPLIGGRVRVEGVPAGLWTLQVTAPDGQVWSGSAASVPHANVAVRFE